MSLSCTQILLLVLGGGGGKAKIKANRDDKQGGKDTRHDSIGEILSEGTTGATSKMCVWTECVLGTE